MRPILYMQTDSRWRTVDYSAPGESTTIGKAGCGPTCAAMVIASLKDKDVTPIDTARWSLSHGYKAFKQGTYYTYFKPQMDVYGIKCSRINASNIYKSNTSYAKEMRQVITDCLKMGHWVIACMGKGTWTSSGHFVLAWKTDGTNVYINDPASMKSNRMKNRLSIWEDEIKYAWEIIPTFKEEKKEDDEVVENKEIAVLGKDVKVPTIFKDGTNYVSIRALCEAMGYKVSSDGSTPIINNDVIKVKINGKTKALSGTNANGVTYAGIRAVAEALGHEVDWDDTEKAVVIK